MGDRTPEGQPRRLIPPGAEFPIVRREAIPTHKLGDETWFPLPELRIPEGVAIEGPDVAHTLRRGFARFMDRMWRVHVDGIPVVDDPWPDRLPLWPALDRVELDAARLRERARWWRVELHERAALAWTVIRHGDPGDDW